MKQKFNETPPLFIDFRTWQAFKRICEADVAGDNSSFIFTVYVKCVPLYHFKLAYEVLHLAVK